MSAGALATDASTTCSPAKAMRSTTSACGGCTAQNNLAVRKRRKAKRASSERMPLLSASAVNEVWSLDFVMDSLANGRRIKCLTVVDDFSRECVDIAVDHGIGGEYVTRLLEQAGQFRGFPDAVRTDQGPEFTSRAFMAWAHSRASAPPAQRRGQPDAERLHRELQRQVPRRVPERAVVRDAGPGTPGDLHAGAATTTRSDRTARSAASRRHSSPLRIASSLAMRSTNRRSSNLQTDVSPENLDRSKLEVRSLPSAPSGARRSDEEVQVHAKSKSPTR